MRYITILLLIAMPFISIAQIDGFSAGVHIGMGNTHCIESDPFGHFAVGLMGRIDGKNEKFQTEITAEWRNGRDANYLYGDIISYFDFFTLWQDYLRGKAAIAAGVGASYNQYVSEKDNPSQKYNEVEGLLCSKAYVNYELLNAGLFAKFDVSDLPRREYPSYHIGAYFNITMKFQ